MAFSICYWANYIQGKTKLSRKSENAVADDRVLKFLYDASVRCHRKYKNGRIKVDNRAPENAADKKLSYRRESTHLKPGRDRMRMLQTVPSIHE